MAPRYAFTTANPDAPTPDPSAVAVDRSELLLAFCMLARAAESYHVKDQQPPGDLLDLLRAAQRRLGQFRPPS